jgi:RNA-directed DNA polymerase
MKVSYDQGVASRVGPESCGGVREDAVEALTGVRAGWVLSLEKLEFRSADEVSVFGRQHRAGRHRKDCPGSAGSKTPCTHASTSQERTTLSYGSREIPGPARMVIRVRAVNP